MATRMVMVPQDTYSNLMSQQKQVYSPVVNQLSNLDQELQSIISNPNLSEDAKYHHYQSVFGRYQTLKQTQFPKPPPTVQMEVQTGPDLPTSSLPIDERQLIDLLPKPIRNKGRILINHLKANKTIQWIPSGELLVDGSPIQGSNITDLVHYVTRRRPTVKTPLGANQFMDLLNKTNAPKEAVTPKDERSSIIGTSFSPQLYSTPLQKPKSSPVHLSPYKNKRIRKQTNFWKPY